MTRVGSIDDLGVRDERGCLGVPVAAEAEDRRRGAEPLREVRERGDADAAAHEERLVHVEPVAVAERAEDVDLVAGLSRCERRVPGPTASSRKLSSPGRRLAEAHRSRQEAARGFEHEELARDARTRPPRLDSQERVGADRLVGENDLSPSLLRTDPFLERDGEVALGVRDRVHGRLRAGHRRDARDPRRERRLADEGSRPSALPSRRRAC